MTRLIFMIDRKSIIPIWCEYLVFKYGNLKQKYSLSNYPFEIAITIPSVVTCKRNVRKYLLIPMLVVIYVFPLNIQEYPFFKFVVCVGFPDTFKSFFIVFTTWIRNRSMFQTSLLRMKTYSPEKFIGNNISTIYENKFNSRTLLKKINFV